MFWGLQASLCVIKYFLNEQQTHVIGQEVTSDLDLQDKQTGRILRSGQSFNRANKEFAVLPDFRYPLDFRWHKQGTWLSPYTNTELGTSRLIASCTDTEATDAASTLGSIPAGFMSIWVLMVPNADPLGTQCISSNFHTTDIH